MCESYFGDKCGDQNKLWISRIAFKTCMEHLRTKNKQKEKYTVKFDGSR